MWERVGHRSSMSAAEPSGGGAEGQRRRELEREVKRLEAVITRQIGAAVTLEHKQASLEAELIDTRHERNDAAKRAAMLQEELTGLTSRIELERSGHELTRRIRLFFSFLSEAQLREELTSRTALTPKRLRSMSKEQLVERLLGCYHKRPQVAATSSWFGSGGRLKYLSLAVPLLALAARLAVERLQAHDAVVSLVAWTRRSVCGE